MYDEKKKDYFLNIRKELLDLIPIENRNGTMLEIGAASGDNSLYAKKNGYAKNIYGIELFKMEDSNQENILFDEFIIGNIEDLEFKFENEKFDVILAGDVLEHLIDPYIIVEKLNKYLKPNGVLISSIPNIRYFRVLKDIVINGNFKYAEKGVLDKTHLRFFAKKNIIDLFEMNNYKVEKIKSNLTSVNNKSVFLNKITFGLLEEFLTKQYFVVCYKSNK
jgi:2-polyprenyl-3-methyl-5-hydroxy-6-metoxy-1,4-benzoquinol methylase